MTELETIARWVTPGARVLDLGCGDGSLLQHLWRTRQAPGYGVEIDDTKVLACLKNDVNVLQMDLEDGLAAFADRSFDYVILSETLQAIHRQEPLLRRHAARRPRGHRLVPELRLLARAHPDRARRPHAGVEGPALPVVRHAERAPLHAGRLRSPVRQDRPAQVLERVVLTAGQPVSVLPNLLGALAVYRVGGRALPCSGMPAHRYCSHGTTSAEKAASRAP